jgi:Anti-sigma-K factor rskA
MRRYVAIGAAMVALAYFLDPENGRRRRRVLLERLKGVAQGTPEPATEFEATPAESVAPRRAPVRHHEPTATESRPVEPVVAAVAAEPEVDEAPRSVAVAEPPAPEAVLPPPLPKDVLETPAATPTREQHEPMASPAPKRRGRLIGAGLLIVAALAAAALAAWSLDVFDGSDDEPSASAPALSALVERQAKAISIMAQPGATRLPVVGAEESLLLVVGMEGDAVLIVSRLDRAPTGQTYEIWVISGNTPRPAGLFQGGRDAVVPLTRVVPKGATVALTLEPVGGSPGPTSDPLYAVKRN